MTRTQDNDPDEREDGGGRPGAARLGAALAALGVAAALVAGCGGGPSDGGGTAGPEMSGAGTGTGQGGALPAVAGQAPAQQAGSTVLREATGEVTVPRFNRSSTELEDMNLLSHTGEEIGEIERVLVDEDGRPAAVTAEVGGFLGVGQKTVVIGLDRLRLEGEDEPDLATTLTREEMQSLQAWAGR
jgi:hypothetical protein